LPLGVLKAAWEKMRFRCRRNELTVLDKHFEYGREFQIVRTAARREREPKIILVRICEELTEKGDLRTRKVTQSAWLSARVSQKHVKTSQIIGASCMWFCKARSPLTTMQCYVLPFFVDDVILAHNGRTHTGDGNGACAMFRQASKKVKVAHTRLPSVWFRS